MLGSLIRAWRQQERYGVCAAAAMNGVSPATLSRIENGEAVDQWTMMKLMRWLFEGSRKPLGAPTGKTEGRGDG